MDWIKIITIYLMSSVVYIMVNSDILYGVNKLSSLKTKKYWDFVKYDFIMGFFSCIILVNFSNDNPFVIYSFFINILILLISVVIGINFKKYDISFLDKLNYFNRFLLFSFFSFILIPYLLIFKKRNDF